MRPIRVTSKQQYSMSALIGWRVCIAWILVYLGSNFLIVNRQGLQAVKGIGSTTFVVFTKACLPSVSVSSNFYHPDTEGAGSFAQCRLGVILGCQAFDCNRCGMQSAENSISAYSHKWACPVGVLRLWHHLPPLVGG